MTWRYASCPLIYGVSLLLRLKKILEIHWKKDGRFQTTALIVSLYYSTILVLMSCDKHVYPWTYNWDGTCSSKATRSYLFHPLINSWWEIGNRITVHSKRQAYHWSKFCCERNMDETITSHLFLTFVIVRYSDDSQRVVLWYLQGISKYKTTSLFAGVKQGFTLQWEALKRSFSASTVRRKPIGGVFFTN